MISEIFIGSNYVSNFPLGPQARHLTIWIVEDDGNGNRLTNLSS